MFEILKLRIGSPRGGRRPSHVGAQARIGPGLNPLPLKKIDGYQVAPGSGSGAIERGLVEEVPASAASQRLPKRSHLR